MNGYRKCVYMYVCVCVCVYTHTYTCTCHTTEYFSAIEKKEILPFGEIYKDLRILW